jgi:hypothetical protein
MLMHGGNNSKVVFLFCFGFANAWRFDPKKRNWVDLLMHEGYNSKKINFGFVDALKFDI